MVGMGRDEVEHGERYEAHNHHLKQLFIVKQHEGVEPSPRFRRDDGRQHGAILIFHHQPIGAEKQEDRHTIMTKERQHMQRQQRIGVGDGAQKVAHVGAEKLVFVFFHHRIEPMAIVMHEDTDDSQPSHGFTFGTGEQLMVHFLFFFSL